MNIHFLYRFWSVQGWVLDSDEVVFQSLFFRSPLLDLFSKKRFRIALSAYPLLQSFVLWAYEMESKERRILRFADSYSAAVSSWAILTRGCSRSLPLSSQSSTTRSWRDGCSWTTGYVIYFTIQNLKCVWFFAERWSFEHASAASYGSRRAYNQRKLLRGRNSRNENAPNNLRDAPDIGPL